MNTEVRLFVVCAREVPGGGDCRILPSYDYQVRWYTTTTTTTTTTKKFPSYKFILLIRQIFCLEFQ